MQYSSEILIKIDNFWQYFNFNQFQFSLKSNLLVEL